MANLARAVVLVASATLTIVAVGPEPQGSPWETGYFPNFLLVTQDSHTIHSYDLIKDSQLLVTFTATNCRDVCALETARRFNIDEAEPKSDRVVIGNEAASHWLRRTSFDNR